MTASDLITAALRTIGILAEGETASAESAADAFLRLNDWIDSLGTERLTIYAIARTVQALVASTASYTIGSGGTINIARPEWIDHATVIPDVSATTPVELDLEVLTDQQWQAVTMKSLTSTLPQAIYFDHGWTAGLGRIYVWPIPTGTPSLVLYTPTALTEFADLTTDYTFPAGYRRFFRYNFGLDLCDDFDVPPQRQAAISLKAAQAKGAIKRANLRLRTLGMDPALLGSGGYGYNIVADGPAR